MQDLIVALVKSILIVGFLLAGFAYMTLLERKLVGRIQVRYGPNRTGPFGLLQPIADGIKLLFKEDIRPAGSDVVVHALAPFIAVSAAMVSFSVIPIGPSVNLFGLPLDFVLANPNVGILVYLAATSLGVYGIVLAGWASNSKYSLLGGIRSSAQMISYELGLGLSLVGPVLIVGSLSPVDIVNYQASVPLAVIQPLAFILYVIAAVAEVNRAPFDLPEAENELVAGYHTEYTGLKYAMFMMAEYINMITVSAVATTIFLGGWRGPILPGPHWFFLKVAFLLVVFIWVRATLPRLRYDRLMWFGWTRLLPLAILNVVVTAAGIVLLT